MQISVASSSLISKPIIEAIRQSEHTLASLITLPDRKVGRGQNLSENVIATWCQEQGIKVAKPADIASINQHLLEVQPQLVVTASYGKLIPPELLHGPRFGWLNLHFSLLPRWRGAAPVQWAILEGDERTGITIFKLDKGMDTGPIYLQEDYLLDHTKRTEKVLEELSILGGNRILDVIGMIARAEKPKTQSHNGITLAPKISKEMGLLDWNSSAIVLDRQVRALSEKPGTFTTFRGNKLVIHGIEITSHDGFDRTIGAVWVAEDRLFVRGSDATLELLDVTPAGKKRMSSMDFARGARILQDERFDPIG